MSRIDLNTTSNWKRDKLFRLADLITSGGTPQSGNESYYDGNIYWVQSGDLNDGYITETEKKITEEGLAISSAKLFPKGTFLVAMYGATIGKLGILEMDAATNQACCAIVPSSKLHTRFLYYYFLTIKDDLIRDAYGGGQSNISQSIIKQLYLVYPSNKLQVAIAIYLDKTCADIDKTIRLKLLQKTTINEYCKSRIAEIVTKGIDKDASFVECRIPWLPNLPENWKVSRLKTITDLRSGDGITSESISEAGEYPVFGGNGLRGYTENYTHEGHFVLIGRQGALCGNINYASGKFFASEHAVVLTPIIKYDTLWLGELLRYMNLNQYSNAAAQPGLSVEKIKNLYIPLPKYEEQILLSSEIRKVIDNTKLLVDKIDQQIKTLEEYKKALIHEVVTGKKQVYFEEAKANPSKSKNELTAAT